MQFFQHTHVSTRDGKPVGHVECVVLNPKTRQVTHIVIHKGLFMPEEKVVPVEMIAAANINGITLRMNSTRLEQFDDLYDIRYDPVEPEKHRRDLEPPAREIPAMSAYPSLGDALLMDYTALPYVARVEEHIPRDTVALREGTQVISRDAKTIGSLQDVLTDPTSNRVTHFVIARGLLYPEKKVIPAGWIQNFTHDQVHLTVRSDRVDELPVVEEA